MSNKNGIIIEQKSEILKFYQDKSIFITGASGFVGKVLLEKLLRTCIGIKKIYILLRTKKDLSSNERLKILLSQPLFQKVNKDVLESKVVAINGDITLPYLGISDNDRATLLKEVSIVYHSAASVKFNDPLDESFKTNVVSVKSVLELCHKMENLCAFIHVSTAYAYCQNFISEEKLYPVKLKAEQLEAMLKFLGSDTLRNITKHLLEGRPNTYTFTKALAEHYINDNRGQLPVAIIRPSIVTGVYKEPLKGWTDTVNGPGGAFLLGLLGIARTMNIDASKSCDMIPVDVVANGIISVSVTVGLNNNNNNNNYNNNNNNEESNELKIYNIASNENNRITHHQYLQYGREIAFKYPSTRMIRPPAQAPKSRPSFVNYLFVKYISELFFAYLVDTILALLGHKRIVVDIVRKMHRGFETIEYFGSHEWTFPTKNIEEVYKNLNNVDRNLFCLSIKDIDWRDYIKHFFFGLRKYILKEDDNDFIKARVWFKKLRIIFGFFNGIWYLSLFYLFYCSPLFMIMKNLLSKLLIIMA